MNKRSGRTEDVWVEPGCNLACAVCDCRNARNDALDRTLRAGGARLEIRGEAATQATLGDVVRRAHEGGWSRVAVRTNGAAYGTPERARALRDLGVDEVVFFLISERAAVHDAVARVRGAHAAGLRGARALAEAGFAMSIEVPVLSPTLQDLRATLDLALTATGAKRARLYSPTRLWDGSGEAARELAPPRWSDVRGSVSAAIELAHSRGVELSLGERDGIPLCGVLGDGEIKALLPERDQRPMTRGAASRLADGCASCAARAACPGVTDLYLATHGGDGLTMRRAPSRDLVQKKVRPDAAWSEERRDSAKSRYLAVMRPTVDCNQDCWFCSANETSQNVEGDAAKMSRKILRLARSGTTHLSFSGGEPTLSRHLIEHVALAREAGIRVIELVTNAVLLDRPEKVDAFANAGVTNLFVSLHGHDESTSRLQTRKVGDHARTTRALQLFVERTNVVIRLNHVITARNYRALVRFVEWVGEQFGTRVSISFAYLTPQYKALERLGEVLPPYRETLPFLRKALARARELSIECIVGSRQGVPPCVLGDFAVFSDVAEISDNAQAEDAPQKTKPESCRACRFDALCTGVWKSYAEVHGTAELVPVGGAAVLPHEDLADALGIRALPASSELTVADVAPRRSLDVVYDREPIPVALVGTGPRALRVARAAADAGLRIVGVASPHALEKDLPELSGVVRAGSLAELLTRVQPRAVIVASSTADHARSARTASEHGLAVLVEKPLAIDAAEAGALIADCGGVSVAHQMRMAPGFQELLREARARDARIELRITHRVHERSPEAMHTWSRGQLYETLIHLLDLAVAAFGRDLTIDSARGVGASQPESIEVRGHNAAGRFTLTSEPRSPEDRLEVEAVAAECRVRWTRRPGDEEIAVTDTFGARSRNPESGSDLTRLLAAWGRSIDTTAPPPVSAADGAAAMSLASDVLRRLEADGVPFERAHAPRHASSRELRERY
jgi:MoaA/NifB/PqqE/SkfB family radical SAM enzyme/predicted dehydrogenase